MPNVHSYHPFNIIFREIVSIYIYGATRNDESPVRVNSFRTKKSFGDEIGIRRQAVTDITSGLRKPSILVLVAAAGLVKMGIHINTGAVSLMSSRHRRSAEPNQNRPQNEFIVGMSEGDLKR